jgi:hypothetical protein
MASLGASHSAGNWSPLRMDVRALKMRTFPGEPFGLRVRARRGDPPNLIRIMPA